MRTGDLGFLSENELFVTGRLKDLLIIRGCNYYPQDIEATVAQSHYALRQGCGAVFSVEVNDEEKLVIVQEVELQHRTIDTDDVIAAIRQAVAEHHSLAVHDVVLLKTGYIPKTSSGKIQRQQCKASYLTHTLEVLRKEVCSK
jgi:acyl-CoA synthetase (AMP-forming)/AMP-acid ligase II